MEKFLFVYYMLRMVDLVMYKTLLVIALDDLINFLLTSKNELVPDETNCTNILYQT